jgi:hypothetical protein
MQLTGLLLRRFLHSCLYDRSLAPVTQVKKLLKWFRNTAVFKPGKLYRSQEIVRHT